MLIQFLCSLNTLAHLLIIVPLVKYNWSGFVIDFMTYLFRTKTPGPGAQSALRALARSGMKIGRIGELELCGKDCALCTMCQNSAKIKSLFFLWVLND